MSDAGSQPPPPPPPPSLTPPPGYTAYEPSYSGSVPLRRVGGLRTAILIVLVVFAIGTVIQIAATPVVVDGAEDFLAGSIDEDDFNEKLAANALAGLLSLAATITLTVLTMIWLHRIASNHRGLGRRLTWGPGWAIGGWFLPPGVVYAIPMLMLRESWKAADPAVPAGDDRWRSNGVNPLIYVWWVLFGLAPIVFLVAGLSSQLGTFGQDTEDIAESFRDDQGVMIGQSVVSIAAAVAWGLLVRALTDRHTRLTGESASG